MFDRIKNLIAGIFIIALLTFVGAIVIASPDYRLSLIEMIPFIENNKGFSIERNIAYGKGPSNSGDIYSPLNLKTPAPAAVVIHGGGWRTGSKNDAFEKGVSRHLAQNGFVAYNIDYPLVGEGGGFPKEIKAAKDAVLFLEENASKFQINPDAIFLVGYSSGAQIAMMAAYTSKDKILAPRDYPDEKLPVKAVAAFAAPANLVDDDHQIINDYLKDFDEMKEPEARIFASPITYASSAVPTILVHGTEDRNVSIAQSDALAKELVKEKIPSRIVRLEGGDHFIGPATREAAMKQVVEFFNTSLIQVKSWRDPELEASFE